MSARALAWTGLIAAWLLSIAWLYHDGSPARTAVLRHQAPRILLLACILLGALAMGRFVSRRLDDGARTADANITLGLALLSVLWLLLASGGALRPSIALALAALGAASGVAALIQRLRLPEQPAPQGLDLPRAAWPFLALAGCGLVMILPMALAPPASTDELTYHLTVPRWFMEAGRMVALPHVAHAAFPFQVEMLYTWPLLLGEPVVAKLIHFTMGLLAVLACARQAALRAGPLAGAIAAALLLTTPAFLLNMSWALADVATALYVVTGTAALLHLRREGTTSAALIAGLLWGMALGTKYTAIGYFALALPACLWSRGDVAHLRQRVRHALLVAGIALAMLSPHLARNAVVHGNPVHPLGDSAWGRGTLANEQAFYTHDRGQAGLVERLRGPLAYSLSNKRADDTLGPLWLMVAPLIVLAALARRAAIPALEDDSRRIALVGLVSALGLSVLQSGTVRLQLPALALLAIPAGELLASSWTRGRLQRAAILSVILVAGASNLAILAWHDRELFDPVKVALGIERESSYLARMEPNWILFDRLNREATSDTKVLALGTDRLFWLEVPVVASSVLDVSPMRRWIAESRDAIDLAARLRGSGITHVLFAREAFAADVREGPARGPWTDEDLAKLDAFLADVAIKDARAGSFELYRVP